jgi:hypothetical protein
VVDIFQLVRNITGGATPSLGAGGEVSYSYPSPSTYSSGTGYVAPAGYVNPAVSQNYREQAAALGITPIEQAVTAGVPVAQQLFAKPQMQVGEHSIWWDPPTDYGATSLPGSSQTPDLRTSHWFLSAYNPYDMSTPWTYTEVSPWEETWKNYGAMHGGSYPSGWVPPGGNTPAWYKPASPAATSAQEDPFRKGVDRLMLTQDNTPPADMSFLKSTYLSEPEKQTILQRKLTALEAPLNYTAEVLANRPTSWSEPHNFILSPGESIALMTPEISGYAWGQLPKPSWATGSGVGNSWGQPGRVFNPTGFTGAPRSLWW